MLKISLLFKKFTNFTRKYLEGSYEGSKFSGYCFYMNLNTQGDFQICIIVPLETSNRSSHSKLCRKVLQVNLVCNSLREKCPNIEFFLVRIFQHLDRVSLRIQSECEKIRTRKNSVFGHFSRSGFQTQSLIFSLKYFQFFRVDRPSNNSRWLLLAILVL